MKLFNFDPNIKIIENDEINLVNLWKVIWGGRWFITLVTFSEAVLAALYIYINAFVQIGDFDIYGSFRDESCQYQSAAGISGFVWISHLKSGNTLLYPTYRLINIWYNNAETWINTSERKDYFRNKRSYKTKLRSR